MTQPAAFIPAPSGSQFSPLPFPQIEFGSPSIVGIGNLVDATGFRSTGQDLGAAGVEAGSIFSNVLAFLQGFLPDRRRAPPPSVPVPDVDFPGGFPLPFPFPEDPTTPRVGEGGFIIETGTDIAQLPRDPRIPPSRITRIRLPPPIIPFPRDGSGDDDMALPPFFGSGPGFDVGDIFDIGGRIIGDPTVPFGGFNTGFGGVQLNVATRGNGNGGTTQVANGACPPPRARMPSSIMADDPCSPTNPTIYIKAGKASSALWPAVISSQAKRLSTANKSIPKKVVRRKKK